VKYRCRFNDLIDKLVDFTKRTLGNRFDHGYPHVLRVWRYAYEIIDNTGLNIDYCVLDVSILLHDVGRIIGEPHAYYSGLIARSLLVEYGLDNDVIEKVVNSIHYHSYSYVLKHGIKPICEEAKILSDADKLDALGVNGFIRLFLFNPDRDIDEILDHYREKILKLPDLMHYEYTRRKALELRDMIMKVMDYYLRENMMYHSEV